MSILNKINKKLKILESVNESLSALQNDYGYNSRKDFINYLSEGSLINLTGISSVALNIPIGEYIVLENKSNIKLFSLSNKKEYNVFSESLYDNWYTISKPICEEEDSNSFNNFPVKKSDSRLPGSNSNDDDDDEEISMNIDKSTVDRLPILNAMENHGETVTSLADKCGVDPPAISRILRKPHKGSGDPGGRNPSIGLAAEICKALRISPTAAFPDIFKADEYEHRKTKANSGSGNKGDKGEASKMWTQGNTSESKSHRTSITEENTLDKPIDSDWNDPNSGDNNDINTDGLHDKIEDISDINNDQSDMLKNNNANLGKELINLDKMLNDLNKGLEL